MARRNKLLFASAFLFLAASACSQGCDKGGSGTDGGQATSAPSTSAPAADLTLPGIDTSILTPRERKDWSAAVTEILSPCPDVPVSLAQCVKEQRACSKCVPAAKMVVKLVQLGTPKDQIERLVKARFDPAGVKDLPIDDSPAQGPSSAPHTIVEFADFECPGCAQHVPIIDAILEKRKDQIRLVYKVVVLPMHKRAEPAARAALAAREQGKFWEMHHKLFENQRTLQDSDLEGFARALGLDVGKFKADMTSAKVSERIEKDRKLADAVKIDHTPTIFFDGREIEMDPEKPDAIFAELLGESPAASRDAGAAPTDAGGLIDASTSSDAGTKKDAGKGH